MSTNTTREYDLTHKLSEYLDLHLILPLLDFLETCEVYPADEVKAAKLEIIQTTNMLDYAIEIYKELHKGAKVPADLEERRDLVFSRLEILKEQAHGLILALEDSAFVERMSSEVHVCRCRGGFCMEREGEREAGRSGGGDLIVSFHAFVVVIVWC